MTAVAGAGLGLAGLTTPGDRVPTRRAEESLRILVLGGTGFIGPHIVRRALSRGHTVSIFNRGKTNPHLFPNVEKLIGDRDDDLESLKGHDWDAVIDDSASIPRWVRQSAGLLKGHAGQYLYTSSMSVYAKPDRPGLDETAPLATIDDPTVEKITAQTYGPLKALCEQEADRAFPDHATIVRPHLIVGPGDPTDRFTYWPVRVDRGGEVLAPGDPTDPVQFIDARDLADWYIHLVENRIYGVFNAVGPASPLSMAGLLYGIRAVTTARVSFTWVNADFLSEQKVSPWSDMPVWIPPQGDFAGFAQFNPKKAIDNGLSYRPLAVTARETLDWFETLPEDRRSKPKTGLTPEREAEVLAAWHARAD